MVKKRERPRWLWHRSVTAIVVPGLFAVLAAPNKLPAQGTSEYDVKAAFLYHFAQFVQWPLEAFRDKAAPLIICTVGDDPFRGALDVSVKDKSVGEHPLQVRHLKEQEQIRACHVLFVGAAQKKYLNELLAGASGRPMLTVGETEGFTRQGGMIGFFLENNKTRFDINVDAAEKARLKISSRLLLLAKTVIGNTSG